MFKKALWKLTVRYTRKKKYNKTLIQKEKTIFYHIVLNNS